MPAVKTRPAVRKSRSPHGVWSSHRAFLLAAIGSVVWLNNLYQLPYLASQYGGAAFLIVYLFGLALIGLPLLVTELLLGQRGRLSPPGAMTAVVRDARLDRRWSLYGWFSLIAGFLVFAYYSVIGGWALAHGTRALVGAFSGLTLDGIGAVFTAFLRDPEKQLFWHALFLAMVTAVVARGLHGGIEFMTRYAVPAIFVLLTLMLLYAAGLDTFAQGLETFLYPDFTRLSAEGVLAALGHAFFGLSLGVGAMMAYGARLPADSGVVRLAGLVIGADVLVALVAGLVLFPVLAAAGFAPPRGVAVIFQEMPVAFDHLPAGGFMRLLFLLLVVLVVWTSVVSFVEPLVLWLVERFEVTRPQAALACAGAGWLLGLMLMLSFNYWSFRFSFFGVARQLGVFDVLLIVTHVLLPVSALIAAALVGWKLHRLFDRETLKIRSLCVYDVWLWSLRIVTPVLLLIILFSLPKLFL